MLAIAYAATLALVIGWKPRLFGCILGAWLIAAAALGALATGPDLPTWAMHVALALGAYNAVLALLILRNARTPAAA